MYSQAFNTRQRTHCLFKSLLEAVGIGRAGVLRLTGRLLQSDYDRSCFHECVADAAVECADIIQNLGDT